MEAISMAVIGGILMMLYQKLVEISERIAILEEEVEDLRGVIAPDSCK